jgi:hypothetical protein
MERLTPASLGCGPTVAHFSADLAHPKTAVDRRTIEEKGLKTKHARRTLHKSKPHANH